MALLNALFIYFYFIEINPLKIKHKKKQNKCYVYILIAQSHQFCITQIQLASFIFHYHEANLWISISLDLIQSKFFYSYSIRTVWNRFELSWMRKLVINIELVILKKKRSSLVIQKKYLENANLSISKSINLEFRLTQPGRVWAVWLVHSKTFNLIHIQIYFFYVEFRSL